jgi:hypothetical protein
VAYFQAEVKQGICQRSLMTREDKVFSRKSSGLTAEEIIITWHHLQAHEFLEVWMNNIHPVCPLALFVQIK